MNFMAGCDQVPGTIRKLTLLSRTPPGCAREPIYALKEKLPRKTLRRLVVLVWVYCQFEFWGAAVQNFSEPKGFRDSHRYTTIVLGDQLCMDELDLSRIIKCSNFKYFGKKRMALDTRIAYTP